MALETAWLSWRTRMPIISAWSTPGAALVAASSGFTMNDAVGAFIIVALLLILTGVLKPLTRLISRIPASVASGMLAGIVVSFAINAVKTVAVDPVLILPLIAAFFLIRLFNPALSVLAVLIGGGLAAFLFGRVGGLPAPELSTLVLITPAFSLSGTIGLAIPLYLVTMASQNLSGLAVLKAAGYEPEPGPIIAVTGIFSLFSALFGALTTNLAAISAAICTGPDVHPDMAERWKTGPFYALAYLIFAVFGASLVAIFAVLPSSLIVLVAGLALMAPLANALSIALKDERERMAATTTFAVTASGLVLFGVGSAFWGLIAGLVVLALESFKKS
jgi:benzoate membrane transport protein